MLSAKPWRLEAVFWFCAAQVGCLFAGLTTIAVFQKIGFMAFQPPAGPGAVIIGTLTFQGATWILIPFFLRRHQVHWRDAFGLHRTELNRAWLLALPAVLAFLPIAWLLQFVSVTILTKIGSPPGNEMAVTVLTSAQSWWLRIYLCIFTVIIGPVAEEFIFRGMLYPFFKQRSHPILAWFLVSILFALVHWDAGTFLALFVLALMLTWLYEKTDNLLAPIAAHAIFNTVNLILLYYFQYHAKPDGP